MTRALGRSGGLTLLCALLALLAGPSPAVQGGDEAAEPADVRAQVDRWIEDLRSEEFAVREAAREGLETYGGRAIDLLEAHRGDPDPEVRRTVRLLLERLGGEVAPPPLPTPGDLQAIGRVRLRGGEEPLAEVLSRLGEPFFAGFDLPDDGPALEPVSAFELEGVPFFAAVERLASEAGLAAPGRFDAAGHLALRAGPSPVPWAAAGPLRVRAVEVTSVRRLGAGGRRYQVECDVDWIPAVQVVTWRTPRNLKAADPEGRIYRPGPAMRSEMTFGVGSTATGGRFTLHLEPEVDDALEHLAQLSFDLPVRLRHDRVEVVFERPTEDLPRTLPPEGRPDVGQVTLRALGQPDGPSGPYVVDLQARLPGSAAQQSLQVFLVDADGGIRSANAGTRFPSADGLIDLTARAWGRWEQPPVRVHVAWFRVEEEGTLPFRLEDVPLH